MLSPVVQTVDQGAVFELGLFAVSDSAETELISALDVVLAWDQTKVQLVDAVDNGPFDWILSGFLDDTNAGGLNDSHLDGDGLYQAVGNFNIPAEATPEGLLVTTFRFAALATTNSTDVVLLPELTRNQFISRTRVFKFGAINEVITGMLRGASVSVRCMIDEDCDDGLFCTGVETCDAQLGCVSSGNPCPVPAACDEDRDVCGCDAPAVAAGGSRYLIVTPAAGDEPVALMVSGDPKDTGVLCVTLYVQTDGLLGTTPVRRTPEQWGSVSVRGAEIQPATLYEVRSDCGETPGVVLSESANATTWIWGDSNDDGTTDFADIARLVDGFRGQFHRPGAVCTGDADCMDVELDAPHFRCDQAVGSCLSATVANLDLTSTEEACGTDGVIDFSDISFDVDAFRGFDFPCTEPCAGRLMGRLPGAAFSAVMYALTGSDPVSLSAEPILLTPGATGQVVVSGAVAGASTFGVTILTELQSRSGNAGSVVFTSASPVDVTQVGDPWPAAGTFTPFDTDAPGFSSTLNGTVDDNGVFLAMPLTFSGPLSAFPVVASSDALGVWDVVLDTSAGRSSWEGLPTTLATGSVTVIPRGDVPALSQWGVSVLIILLLTAGTVIFTASGPTGSS